MVKSLILFLLLACTFPGYAQDYFFKKQAPFNPDIPSPEDFLGYPIGFQHTRHDMIVAYLEKLAEASDRATITYYGKSHEHRKLVILNISSPENINKLEDLRLQQVQVADPTSNMNADNLPIFVNLGYNVHGNEPSSSEAALLTAYVLAASTNQEIVDLLNETVVFLDPTINPDGRDRHTHWANTHKGNPLVDDPMDIEHNEISPSGRTNHYYFDLNRDWWLAIHPESRGKLNWYHQWYPNVVTDFHEMGTNSTYFFEPMKVNASKNPIMPKENYTTLNEAFAKHFSKGLDEIGSMYFTKEVFDGTYPGYGSSYPDLQGGLALLFEQASSRGHVQKQNTGEQLTFAFTIRNQYTSSLTTLNAALENKTILQEYQKNFFKSAISNAAKSRVKGYVFGDENDKARTNAFIDKLLIHRVKVYELGQNINTGGKSFKAGEAYVVPTEQPQYRLVQSAFETYNEYTDSVFYDASAWSLANFYNMPFGEVSSFQMGKELKEVPVSGFTAPQKSSYAYIMTWNEYNAPAALYFLQSKGVVATSAFKPFEITTDKGRRNFGFGTLVFPVGRQFISADSLHQLLTQVVKDWEVDISTTKTGYSTSGIDLGSGNLKVLEKPKAVMLVGEGINSYEHGEVWHLLDTRVNMPITKVPMRNFSRLDLNNYNVMVMVSGSYNQLDSNDISKIKDWVGAGNTLITSRTASKWAIEKKLVNETLIEEEKDTIPNKEVKRLDFVDSREHIGKKSVGGAIFETDLDITHPLGFGYTSRRLPVYRNSTVWLAPSKSPYGTVAKYTENPHIDGFITDENLNKFLKPSASLIVSPVKSGRVILFADNPNFRGSWYGTNRLFLNALFLGKYVAVPK
ncbi:M14 family zinc carboxypeptidase [Flexithrix dorotheae]|uniref:M14 family zinc carboxypeptidase n=1 Tax=Flexithrix dorotheae TaxID=70993 RepID=UPI000363D2E2|nr:M14 family zinc carboxypeptidase [Flexithrix dorotheae]